MSIFLWNISPEGLAPNSNLLYLYLLNCHENVVRSDDLSSSFKVMVCLQYLTKWMIRTILDILISMFKDKERNAGNWQGLNQHLLKVEQKSREKSEKSSSKSAGKSFCLEATLSLQDTSTSGGTRPKFITVHYNPTLDEEAESESEKEITFSGRCNKAEKTLSTLVDPRVTTGRNGFQHTQKDDLHEEYCIIVNSLDTAS